MYGQCSLITVNGSSQDPKSVCAPVDFTMDAKFEFLVPVDTTLVQILFRWNDGTGAESLVSGNWNTNGDSIWASANHIYPPTDECSRTAEAIIVFDGELCLSSGYQSQIFSTWGTDEENSGILNIAPEVYRVCEGEDIIDVTFEDNSTFNCNINIEPDRPNRYYRWVQFVYNTYNQAGSRIPDVTVRDASSVVYQMTDGTGNYVNDLNGPIIRIPIPADVPNQTSYPISAPAGGVAGDIFEITLRNWNVCNPYDNNPTDGIAPADTINGDNPPIETTARIEIVAPTPVTVPSLFEFCTGDNIILTANAGMADVRWYKDAGLDTLLFVGNSFNPMLPPELLDPDIAGTYTYYVTSYEGFCESAPSIVDVLVYQTPLDAFAGSDKTVCYDTITIAANSPTAGAGMWSTSSSAVILNPADSVTFVSNLEFGNNIFTWTITNGPCATTDELIITSDRQPSAAQAGPDQILCDVDPVSLLAIPADQSGRGYWNILSGSGVFADSTNPITDYSGMAHGINILAWRVSSYFGACPITLDTVKIEADFTPGISEAGPDGVLCETSTINLSASLPINEGTGIWNVVSGTGILSDSTLPNATVSGLSYGSNVLKWTQKSKLGICSDNSDSLTIYRYQTPGIADAGIDKEFCFVNQDTLSANYPTVGTANWNVIINPSGVPPTFSPNTSTPNATFTVAPGNEGLYELEWRMANGICTSSDTVIIDLGVPVPQALAGPDTVTCGYDYPMRGNDIAIGLGTWRVLSGPGAVSYTPDEHSFDALTTFLPGNEGIYEFEWKFTSGSCPATADSVTIEITEAPLPPALTDIQSCGPGSFNINVPTANGRQIALWYTSNTEPNYFYRGNEFPTGLLNTSRNYFVSLYDTVSTCESNRTQFSITIDQVPNPPYLFGDTLCGPGQGRLTGINPPPATSIFWYTNSIATNPTDTSQILIIDTITTSQYFWARSVDQNTGCTSNKDSVQIIVWPEIEPPVAYNDSSCGSSSFILRADKSNSSNTLFWYNADNNLINIGDSTQTAIIDSSITFRVAEYNSNTQCLSNQSLLSIMINTIPDLPIIPDTASCGASNFVLTPLQQTFATTYRWYSDPLTSSILFEGTSFSTPLLIANTSYWVAGYNELTGCEGPREEVEISIYPSPGAIDILGPTLVLKDQTNVVFFIIYGQPGSIYNWNIPTDIIVEENMNDFVRLAFPNTGTFTISVTETTANGCVGTPVYHSISVIEDSIAVDIGDYEQSACTAEPYEIKPWLFGGTPPYIYSWTGDTAYLTSTNTLFTTFVPPGTGQFKLYIEVADLNLKITKDSVLITVYKSPTTQITNTDKIACVDELYQLNTENNGSTPFTYYWTGPIHDLNNYVIPNPIYTPRKADTVDFYYILTDVNGCRAYDSIQLISDLPIADFEILTEPGCSPILVEFENTSRFAESYEWTFGDGNSSNQTHPTHTFVNETPVINYEEVNLMAISALGCTDNKKDYVMVWPNPTAEINPLPETSCNPAQTILVSTPGNSIYYWNFGDGSSDTASSRFYVHHTYRNNGFSDKTFNASVITQSSLNCFDTAYTDITVYATPEADFLVSPEEAVFPNSIFKLENLTEGDWNYQWDFGDETGSTQFNPEDKQYDDAGNFTITLRASGEHCSDSAKKLIRLHPSPPLANFKGADNGCMPHTVTLINNSQYADSYLWEFGDGSISTAKDPSYTYYESGIYKIKLTVSGMGGISTFSDTTRVYILPNSYFEIAPRYVYVNDEPVNYFNLSDHGDKYEWDFGDGTTSDELNPKHIYKQAGTYDVTLKVWTLNGCFDLYVMENAVFAEPSGKVEFPNAFRPNSPLDENRVFKPGIIDHVDDYHLMIFNRWGELIFESKDQEVGWNGYFKGKVAKQDVYIWKVKGTYSDGKGFSKTGNVTLLY